MDEYIDREALLQAMQTERDSFRPLFDNYAIGFEEGMRNVRIFPSADVATVRHGRWMFGGDGIVECSVCNETYDVNMLPRNYCPNCGAKMDLEDTNGM